MNEKQRAFAAAYPHVHPQVREFFPDFDYRRPVGDRNVICNMRDPNNGVGHQQRAFNVWWAVEKGGPADMGLDLGCPKGMTPFALHVDIFGTGAPHPFYPGGPYLTDIVYDASKIDDLVPQASLPFITSNHSLEHMPPKGNDGAISATLIRWIRLLRPGGILAMVVPDNDTFDVMAGDPDHKNAWGGSDFRARVLDAVLQPSSALPSGARLVDFNTFQNNFSFDVVLERT